MIYNEYEYWLHDGTHGFVYADRYERYPQEKEIVFYRGTEAVYRIPSEWLYALTKTEESEGDE